MVRLYPQSALYSVQRSNGAVTERNVVTLYTATRAEANSSRESLSAPCEGPFDVDDQSCEGRSHFEPGLTLHQIHLNTRLHCPWGIQVEPAYAGRVPDVLCRFITASICRQWDYTQSL